ncbi:MAG TPA: DoxX family protein [Acidobacteriaceae bacterium]|nr:DoxX family protein [Acidobacteriaceae bacterium]
MEKSRMGRETGAVSAGRLWTGRVIAGLISAFMLLDAAMKFVKPPQVAEAFVRTGWPLELSVPLGAILLTSVLLYLIPRTAVLGAILLTGYFGGAVATNMRLLEPVFSHTLFPVYFGVLTWLALWLREPRLAELIPVKKPA